MRTRRNFLLNCSAVAVTASVTPTTIFSAPRRLAEVPLQGIRFDDFTIHLNTLFDVEGESGPAVQLQLVEVSSMDRQTVSGMDAANEKFSLLFGGPIQKPLAQGSYWFQREGLGRFLMFIVPIGSTEITHSYYEAIFNRPVVDPLPRAGEAGIPVGRAREKRRRLQRVN